MKKEPPDNGVLIKYKHSHDRNRITLGTTRNTPQNFTISSQEGDADKPTTDLRKEETYFVRESKINIDETQQEDVTNYRRTDGVADKVESSDSP